MKKKYSDLISNILLFCISNLIPKLLVFVLIPIYTKNLSTNDYGILELISSTISLVIPIITLNIGDALLRFLLDKNYNDKDVFSVSLSIFNFDLIISGICIFLLYLINPFNLDGVFYVYIYFSLILNIMYNHLCIVLKGINKVKKVVVGSLINSFSTFAIMIYLLNAIKIGTVGYMIGMISGMLLATIYMIFSGRVFQYITFKFNKKVAITMIKYSFPMIFSAIAWWINNSSDRYILALITSTSISGIYALASKIPNILKIFQNIFMQAWSISAIKDFDKNDKDQFVANIFNLLFFSLIILCSFLMIVNIPISNLLFKGAFNDAWLYVPPLLVAVFFDSISLFLGKLFFAVKDTKSLAMSNIIGAVCNIILNFILITSFSAYGAAISTVISYFITLVLCALFLRKHITIDVDNKIICISIMLLLIQMCLAYYGNNYVFIQILLLLFQFILFRKWINKFMIMIKSKIKIKIKGINY